MCLLQVWQQQPPRLSGLGAGLLAEGPVRVWAWQEAHQLPGYHHPVLLALLYYLSRSPNLRPDSLSSNCTLASSLFCTGVTGPSGLITVRQGDCVWHGGGHHLHLFHDAISLFVHSRDCNELLLELLRSLAVALHRPQYTQDYSHRRFLTDFSVAAVWRCSAAGERLKYEIMFTDKLSQERKSQGINSNMDCGNKSMFVSTICIFISLIPLSFSAQCPQRLKFSWCRWICLSLYKQVAAVIFTSAHQGNPVRIKLNAHKQSAVTLFRAKRLSHCLRFIQSSHITLSPKWHLNYRVIPLMWQEERKLSLNIFETLSESVFFWKSMTTLNAPLIKMLPWKCPLASEDGWIVQKAFFSGPLHPTWIILVYIVRKMRWWHTVRSLSFIRIKSKLSTCQEEVFVVDQDKNKQSSLINPAVQGYWSYLVRGGRRGEDGKRNEQSDKSIEKEMTGEDEAEMEMSQGWWRTEKHGQAASSANLRAHVEGTKVILILLFLWLTVYRLQYVVCVCACREKQPRCSLNSGTESELHANC